MSTSNYWVVDTLLDETSNNSAVNLVVQIVNKKYNPKKLDNEDKTENLLSNEKIKCSNTSNE